MRACSAAFWCSSTTSLARMVSSRDTRESRDCSAYSRFFCRRRACRKLRASSRLKLCVLIHRDTSRGSISNTADGQRASVRALHAASFGRFSSSTAAASTLDCLDGEEAEKTNATLAAAVVVEEEGSNLTCCGCCRCCCGGVGVQVSVAREGSIAAGSNWG